MTFENDLCPFILAEANNIAVLFVSFYYLTFGIWTFSYFTNLTVFTQEFPVCVQYSFSFFFLFGFCKIFFTVTLPPTQHNNPIMHH